MLYSNLAVLLTSLVSSPSPIFEDHAEPLEAWGGCQRATSSPSWKFLQAGARFMSLNN